MARDPAICLRRAGRQGPDETLSCDYGHHWSGGWKNSSAPGPAMTPGRRRRLANRTARLVGICGGRRSYREGKASGPDRAIPGHRRRGDRATMRWQSSSRSGARRNLLEGDNYPTNDAARAAIGNVARALEEGSRRAAAAGAQSLAAGLEGGSRRGNHRIGGRPPCDR